MSTDNNRQRLLRRFRVIGIYFVVFVALIGLGRFGEVAYQSWIGGVRAPYLQSLSSDRVVVRWQTEASLRGEVRLGTAPGQWQQVVREPKATTEHRVTISGLHPDTQYIYAVGDNQLQVRWGGDLSYRFRTAPPVGDGRPVRMWVVGDPGYANERQTAARHAVHDWLAAHPRPGLPELDLFLTTGDNAYPHGSAKNFNDNFFAPFARELRTVGAWTVYGNHDARRWAFFHLFDFPTAGEDGGVPSGTDHYYSFDYGAIHFVVLDSEYENLDSNGAMANWLRRDLAATHQLWRVALFHHPPYTRGGHDSDDEHDSGGRMVDMREHFVPILEAGGVDLVLNGHSHDYERTALIACHYGPGATFNKSMVVDADSPYEKRPGAGTPSGTVYAVVGSTAKLDHGPLNDPANVVSAAVGGSLVVDIAGPRLEGRFIDTDGKIFDDFVIEKRADAPVPSLPCH